MSDTYKMVPKENYVEVRNSIKEDFALNCKFYGGNISGTTEDYQVIKWYFDKRNSENE
jgi:hypothetical protein